MVGCQDHITTGLSTNVVLKYIVNMVAIGTFNYGRDQYVV